MLTYQKALILSPHPDDTEFSMAGTIMRYGNTEFTSVLFSTGSVNDPVTDASRWEECKRYWDGRLVGQRGPKMHNVRLEFLSQFLGDYTEEEWINIIEGKFGLHAYDALFIPPLLDTHFEHRFVHGIGMALTRSKAFSVIEYKSASAMDTWIPNMFVPIGSFDEEKIDRLKHFESQKKLYLEPAYMNAFHSHVNSMKKGYGPVEQFRIVAAYE